MINKPNCGTEMKSFFLIRRRRRSRDSTPRDRNSKGPSRDRDSFSASLGRRRFTEGSPEETAKPTLHPVGGDSNVTSASSNNTCLNTVKVESEEILPDSTEDVAMNSQLTETGPKETDISVKSTDGIKKENEPGQSLTEAKIGKYFVIM